MSTSIRMNGNVTLTYCFARAIELICTGGLWKNIDLVPNNAGIPACDHYLRLNQISRATTKW
jgi:hypothetical protein